MLPVRLTRGGAPPRGAVSRRAPHIRTRWDRKPRRGSTKDESGTPAIHRQDAANVYYGLILEIDAGLQDLH